MQSYPNRFEQTLQQGLPAFCLIFGDEPRQKLDCIEALRNKAKTQGFDERQSLVVDAQFEWQTLIDACMSMSLFSSRQYIELELPSGKPGAEGAKVLTQLAQQTNPDTLLLVHGPKIGKDVQNSKWFKTLEKQGIFVHSYPLEGSALHGWLNQQVNNAQLQMQPEAIKLLADFCEGNLLAAGQEINKLALLYPNQVIDLTQTQQALVDQSRFNVFQLVDLMLAGDINRSIKVLNRLESEGLEANIVLWALIREWQTLSQLKNQQQQGQSINWQKLRIWKNKQSLYSQCLTRLSQSQLKQMGDKMVQLDSALKSSLIARPYVELCHLLLLFIPLPLEEISLSV